MKKNETELLSVIVPIYNVESYLPRCLDSIINQTYKNLEIICVDDGSTDKSGEIADAYARKDKRIQVVHKENGGLVSARKVGVLRATGEYAAYVDSDDFIERKMYEEMMKLAVDNSADIVTSGTIRTYENGTVVMEEKIGAGVYANQRLKEKVIGEIIDTGSFFRTNISTTIGNRIIKTSNLKKAQISVDDRIIVGEDVAVVYPLLFRSNVVVVSGKSYYHYCIRESGSIMGTKTVDDLDRVKILLRYLEKEFYNVDEPGLNIVNQFLVLKTYCWLLRNTSKTLRFDGEILYPFGKICKQDQILLYGAGKFGVEMKKYLDEQGFQVVAWVDKNAGRSEVCKPENIPKIQCDIVVIAVLLADVVDQIKLDLKKLGIPKEKIRCVDTNLILENK